MTTEIATQTEVMPEFLKNEIALGNTGIGTEILKTKVSPPRLKIIQNMSGAELKSQFSVGDVILSPSGAVVAKQLLDDQTHKPVNKSDEFYFVPLFYYPEFICVNPYQLKASLPMVRERSLDPTSNLARACQVYDKRKFPCPEDTQYSCVYSECFNFMVMLLTPTERYSDIACMSFRSGEYKAGQSFASLIMSRKTPAIYANVFAATCSNHKHKNGMESFGLDINNPRLKEYGGPGHFVDSYELYQFLATQYTEIKRQYDEKTLEVDYDDERMETAAAQPTINPDGSVMY